MTQSFIKQFRISGSDYSDVQRAIEEANKVAGESKSEIVAVAILSGLGVNNWKLIVAYKYDGVDQL